MKNFIVNFSLIIAICSISCDQERPGRWKKDDIPVKDTADQKVENGFGAAIIVVKDPKAFVDMWYKPEFPEFDTVQEVQRSVEIGAFIMFAGCKPGQNDKCDITVDYSLISPEGKVLGTSLDQIVWNDTPPPALNTHISKASMVLEFKEGNKIGEYKVKAVVHDINANISFNLETHFELK